jgi:hypothetical protein
MMVPLWQGLKSLQQIGVSQLSHQCMVAQLVWSRGKVSVQGTSVVSAGFHVHTAGALDVSARAT